MNTPLLEGNDPTIQITHGDRIVGWCYLSEYCEHIVAHSSELRHPFRREGHHLVYTISDYYEQGLEEGNHRHPSAIWKQFQLCATVEDIINS